MPDGPRQTPRPRIVGWQIPEGGYRRRRRGVNTGCPPIV